MKNMHRKAVQNTKFQDTSMYVLICTAKKIVDVRKAIIKCDLTPDGSSNNAPSKPIELNCRACRPSICSLHTHRLAIACFTHTLDRLRFHCIICSAIQHSFFVIW